MHVKRLSLILVLFLLPCSQVLFVASQAYAWCCMCGTCKRNCDCAGVGGCAWCAAPNPNPETVQSTSPVNDPSADVDIKGIRVAVLSSATERALSDIRQTHGRENFALKLLGDVESDLEFGCSQVVDESWQGNALGFVVKAETEKQ